MKFRCNIYYATLIQIGIVLFLFWSMRFIFYWANASFFGEIGFSHLMRLGRAGIRFDISSVAWFNALFLFLRFLPCDFVYSRTYIAITDGIFIITNFVLLILNLIDIPLYPIFGFRTSLTSLQMFLTEPHILNIIGSFARNYWWAFLIGILILGLMILIVKVIVPVKGNMMRGWPSWQKYFVKTVIFLIGGFLTYVGIWGRNILDFPLSVDYAALHIKRDSEMNIVLNTPFVIINIEDDYRLPKMNFFNSKELESIRNSVKVPKIGTTQNNKNLILITIESGGSLWNKDLNVLGEPPAVGLMPFIDSLIKESLVFKNTLSTSTVTVDGLRNIYGGFPAYGFFLISDVAFSNTPTEGLATLLSKIGYSTKFYYGSYKDSFNFYPFLIETGFQYVTTNETLPRNKGEGLWGHWDHQLAAWAADDISNLPEPFFAGMLTLNPHEPFNLPDDWRISEYQHPKGSQERAYEYIDKTLENFFHKAREKDWYDNTIFIITGDHGARYNLQGIWGTSYIQPHIIFLIFDPSGSLASGIKEYTVSQIDIMPSALTLLGYPYPYLAFGESVFSPTRQNYAFNVINNKYQIIGDRYLVVMDSRMLHVEDVFDIRTDKALKTPLAEYDHTEIDAMVRWGRALMQDYSQRMYGNRMTVSPL